MLYICVINIEEKVIKDVTNCIKSIGIFSGGKVVHKRELLSCYVSSNILVENFLGKLL